MKRLNILIICVLMAASAIAQRTEVYHLWPDGAPTSNGITDEEIANDKFVVNVTDPLLTVYVPEKPCGLAVIACPGGSYLQVWQGTEGHNMAQWYNDLGVVYAVLKYRLPNGHKEVPLNDVHQAMKIMREHQDEFGFTKLGIQGCSAGGHLAATAATHYDGPLTRPDFQILFYPVASFNPAYTHMLSCTSLLGEEAQDEEIVKLYTNELQVTADTPPAFITHSTDDGLVPVKNSTAYYDALVANKVSATMLLFPVGGHGWFGNTQFPYRAAWLEALKVWLDQQIAK